MAKNAQSDRTETVSQSDLMPAEFAANREKQIERLAAIQTELIERLQEANRNWFERAKLEANLASDLAAKLTAARSIPETATVFQEWNSRHTEMAAEDAKRPLAEGQKFMETGARLLSKHWRPNGAGVGSS
jgi:DNA repair exonuclease SbcCD ATPase subunit